MTPKRKVYIGLFAIGAVVLLLIGSALYVESIGVRSPESGDTISELIWSVWANQPWVIFLASHLVAMPSWFLAGHWLASPKGEYDRMRLKSMSREKLIEAQMQALEELRLRNLAR